MRIFLAVRHSKDPARYYGALWSANFLPALASLGHEVAESQVDLLPCSRFMHIGSDFTVQEREARAEITQRIVDEVRGEHARRPIDLFLSYFYNAHFDPCGFGQIHTLGVPTVNFYCNSVHQFDLAHEVARHAAFAWHPERDARAAYLGIGANPVWVQMAADPTLYRPVDATVREPSACFVGQRYADRDRWMLALARADVPLAIYGPGWGEPSGRSSGGGSDEADGWYLGRRVVPVGSTRSYLRVVRDNCQREGILGGTVRSLRQAQYRVRVRSAACALAAHARGPVRPEQIKVVFSAHELVLNLSNVWADGRPGSALVPHVRLRDFEGPMCRACYFTACSDELAQFYEPDKEVLTYSSPEELVEKARFYLAHPAQAERRREAGYRRARRDHTWDKRFQELFAKVGIARAS